MGVKRVSVPIAPPEVRRGAKFRGSAGSIKDRSGGPAAREDQLIEGRLKDRNKMERRLGKIQALHPQVNDLYTVELRDATESTRLFWEMKKDRRAWRKSN